MARQHRPSRSSVEKGYNGNKFLMYNDIMLINIGILDSNKSGKKQTDSTFSTQSNPSSCSTSCYTYYLFEGDLSAYSCCSQRDLELEVSATFGAEWSVCRGTNETEFRQVPGL